MNHENKTDMTLNKKKINAHLGDHVKKALHNKGYLLRIIPGGITGDVQRNDTEFHHPVKTYYRTLKMELMLERLRQNPESFPSRSRDKKMKMFHASWTKVCAEIVYLRKI